MLPAPPAVGVDNLKRMLYQAIPSYLAGRKNDVVITEIDLGSTYMIK